MLNDMLVNEVVPHLRCVCFSSKTWRKDITPKLHKWSFGHFFPFLMLRDVDMK
jgi:hypothetical protein